MYLMMFVLDNPGRLDDVLDAWDAIGVSGVTVVESTGINRRRLARQVGATFMAGMNRMMSDNIETHNTLLTIVKDEPMVVACAQAAEKIVGGLNEPNSGILAAWPVPYVKGVLDPDRNVDDAERPE